MPGGDRTGPAGMGPRTGRGAGYCSGYPVPGYANPVAGRGVGFGRGRGFWGGGGGRGWRNWYYATGLTGWQRTGGAWPWAAPAMPTREQELDGLKGQAEDLEDTLEGIRKRIAEIEAQKSGT